MLADMPGKAHVAHMHCWARLALRRAATTPEQRTVYMQVKVRFYNSKLPYNASAVSVTGRRASAGRC